MSYSDHPCRRGSALRHSRRFNMLPIYFIGSLESCTGREEDDATRMHVSPVSRVLQYQCIYSSLKQRFRQRTNSTQGTAAEAEPSPYGFHSTLQQPPRIYERMQRVAKDVKALFLQSRVVFVSGFTTRKDPTLAVQTLISPPDPDGLVRTISLK
jgi:hypothetical protein